MPITTSKAIELGSRLELPLKTAQDYDNHLAVALGVEGLKAIEKYRNTFDDDLLFTLLGEEPE